MRNKTKIMKDKFKYLFLLIVVVAIAQGCDPTSPDEPITVSDIDGNVYSTFSIGGKVWMAENLRTTRYNDGSAITTGLNDADWTSNTTGAYSIYDDVSGNNTTYGKLYNWHAVHTGILAPTGWHVATETEYNTLIEDLGGSSIAGGKMKIKSSLWDAPNTGATDMSDFKGLPGGYRSYTGGYQLLGKIGYWWANSERNSTQGEYTSLDNDYASSFRNGATKGFGYSVRCVKD